MRPEVKHQRGKTPCSPRAPGAHSQQLTEPHHPGELLNTIRSTRVFKIAAIFHPLIDIIKKSCERREPQRHIWLLRR